MAATIDRKHAGGYLSHIDGIRAVAVLAVVAYHLDLPHFSGGYIGVDVFFVISGFLITRLILGELERTGRLSFRNFYLRRARRLMPALFATLAGSWLLFAWLFPPNRFQELSESMVAAVFSVSNIFFWSLSGYFDSDAATKPLLHTWSLGVEEQFYLFWPLFLYLAHQFGQRVFSAVAVLGGMSFIANFYGLAPGISAEYQSAIFFHVPFRMFEFALGALCIPLMRWEPSSPLLHDLMTVCGLILIIYSSIALDGTVVFPAHNALLPCLGAMLMILASRAWLTAPLLQSRPVVFVGLISYSLYLVHWPLIVAWKYYTLEPLSLGSAAVLFVIMLVLAGGIYHYVEKPLRLPSGWRLDKVATGTGRVLRPLTVPVLLLVALSAYAITSDGMRWRHPGAMAAEDIRKGMRARMKNIASTCRLGWPESSNRCADGDALRILVIGDSHAPDGLNLLRAYFEPASNVELVYFGSTNLCETEFPNGVPVSQVIALKCSARLAALTEPALIKSLDAVFMSANRPFSAGKRHLWRMLEYIHAQNPDARMLVRSGYINLTRDCSELYNRFGSADACKQQRFVSYSAGNDGPNPSPPVPVSFEYAYVNLFDLLCERAELARCTVFAGGKPAFLDKHHFTLEFAKLVGRRLRQSPKQSAALALTAD